MGAGVAGALGAEVATELAAALVLVGVGIDGVEKYVS